MGSIISCDGWPTCIGPTPSIEYFLYPIAASLLFACILAPICYKCLKKDASWSMLLWGILPTVQNIVIIYMRLMDSPFSGNFPEYYLMPISIRMVAVMAPVLIWGIRHVMVHAYRHSFRGEDWRFKKMREE